jgi:clan AA aspartic protease
MISGIVRRDEARIHIRVIGKKEVDIEAVDTGYTSVLTLPPALVAELKLAWRGIGRSILADGSECMFDVYAAQLVWDGKTKRVLIDEADTDPLVGMTLLKGYELKIEVRPKGKVSIEKL